MINPRNSGSHPWRSLWAKSQPMHPLWCHLVDVGTVAEALIEIYGSTWLRNVAGRLGMDEQEASSLIIILATAHDIGKASSAFQRKWDDGRLLAEAAGFRFEPDHQCDNHPHGAISATWLWERLDRTWGGEGAWSASCLAAQCTGSHHGVVLTPPDINPEDCCCYGFEDRLSQTDANFWEAARGALWQLLLDLFNDSAPPSAPLTGLDARIAWLDLMGLISCADWIASSSKHFADGSMAGSDEDPFHYRDRMRKRACDILRSIGWTALPPFTQSRGYSALFPHLQGKPLRPLQAEIQACFAGDRMPRLLVIEAPMGEGKTEAALYAATEWLRAGKSQGAYVALPTQATGNAMFARLVSWIGALHPDGSAATTLVHSGLEKEELYYELHLKGIYDGEQGEPTSGARVDGWFNSSKQGLLATYGAGTIDQALLAALRCRHHFVRFHGLARKLVIFDEVHAYDAYTGRLLDRLIELLAAAGSPVAVLSATLPPSRRAELLAAAGGKQCPDSGGTYPCLHVVEDDGTVQARTFASESRPPLRLEWLPDDDTALIAELTRRLCEGGCAAALLNTVAAAQDFYRKCRESMPDFELHLLHSRFPAGERQEREKVLLRKFGREATRENGLRPARALVIGTQVLEQSLDLDFDVMATQMAPVDLILQRAGRLHRHSRMDRPAGVRQPVLLIRAPSGDSGSAPDYGPSQYVYDRSILLRSHAALLGQEALTLPGDIARLIDFVYENSTTDGLPDAWIKAFENARADWEKEQDQFKKRADGRALPPVSGLSGYFDQPHNKQDDDENSDSALAAQTRLGSESLLAICLHEIDGELFLDGNAPEEKPLPLDSFPSPCQIRELFRRTVPFTSYTQRYDRNDLHDPDFVWIKSKCKVPEAWREDRTLRHLYVIPFRDRVYTLERSLLRWDRELGLVREYRD